MEELLTALEQAFDDYRLDLEAFERKRRPADGLLGLGRRLQDDPCHEKLDERVQAAVAGVCALPPTPEQAQRLAALLLTVGQDPSWPLAAQWMLRAIERHALPLIPHLRQEDAASLLKEYAGRYRPWDRLPVQKQVVKALKAQAGK